MEGYELYESNIFEIDVVVAVAVGWIADHVHKHVGAAEVETVNGTSQVTEVGHAVLVHVAVAARSPLLPWLVGAAVGLGIGRGRIAAILRTGKVIVAEAVPWGVVATPCRIAGVQRTRESVAAIHVKRLATQRWGAEVGRAQIKVLAQLVSRNVAAAGTVAPVVRAADAVIFADDIAVRASAGSTNFECTSVVVVAIGVGPATARDRTVEAATGIRSARSWGADVSGTRVAVIANSGPLGARATAETQGIPRNYRLGGRRVGTFVFAIVHAVEIGVPAHRSITQIRAAAGVTDFYFDAIGAEKIVAAAIVEEATRSDGGWALRRRWATSSLVNKGTSFQSAAGRPAFCASRRSRSTAYAAGKRTNHGPSLFGAARAASLEDAQPPLAIHAAGQVKAGRLRETAGPAAGCHLGTKRAIAAEFAAGRQVFTRRLGQAVLAGEIILAAGPGEDQRRIGLITCRAGAHELAEQEDFASMDGRVDTGSAGQHAGPQCRGADRPNRPVVARTSRSLKLPIGLRAMLPGLIIDADADRQAARPAVFAVLGVGHVDGHVKAGCIEQVETLKVGPEMDDVCPGLALIGRPVKLTLHLARADEGRIDGALG